MPAPIVFCGPSLTTADRMVLSGIDYRPPAAQGDVLRAIGEKPPAIGIIDGYFGDRLAIHQKEILEAMASGIPVIGAASMGALRAAELVRFGMHGIGTIFESYRSGEIDCDADVAVAHGPAELGFIATSVSMVDVRATAAALGRRRVLSSEKQELVVQAAAAMFFVERTWRGVAQGVYPKGVAFHRLYALLRQSHVQQKRIDALELVRRLKYGDPLERPTTKVPPLTMNYWQIRGRALNCNDTMPAAVFTARKAGAEAGPSFGENPAI
ncbi:MAG: TfuA-like protein [Pseudomonadota bacterium]